MNRVPERNESLWLLVVSPTVWMAHFLACYITAAVWCAKSAEGRETSLAAVRLAVGVYTLMAMAAILCNGWGGLRRFRINVGAGPSHADSPEDRHRFLGFATLLLAGMSALATIFVAIVALYFEDCR